MVINALRLTKVETVKMENNCADIRICWTVNGQYAAGYTGKYTAVFLENQKEFQSVEFEDAMGLQDHTICLKDYTGDAAYQVILKVAEQQGGAESDAAYVYIDYFRGISGVYDGDSLELAWETASDYCEYGMYQLLFSNGTSSVGTFDAHGRRLRLERDALVRMTVGAYASMTLYVTDESLISSGIASETVRFNASGISISSCEITQKTEETELTVEVQSVYDDLENVRLSILNGDRVIWKADAVSLVPVAGKAGSYTGKATLPDGEADRYLLERCHIKLTAVYGEVETTVCAVGDTLALQTPQFHITDVDNQGYNCRMIVSDTEVLPCGFEVTSDQTVQTVGYADFIWKVPETDRTQQISVRAKYRAGAVEQLGPSANDIRLPAAGYYPYLKEDGGLALYYRMETQKDGFHSAMVPADVTGELSGNIENDIIKLQKKENGFCLRVSAASVCTAADLDDFMRKLEGKVAEYGMYVLRDMIVRLSVIAAEETAALLCGWEPERRWSDLCPGLELRISMAIYMHQESGENDAAAGFVHVSDSCYSIMMQQGEDYLEFDPFAGGMAKYMGGQSLPNAVKTPVCVSGIADLLQGTLRQPYYGILYPQTFTSAESAESPYASDNVVLIASDSYQKLRDASDALADNPAVINSLNLPVLVFRGRSCLTPCIRITVAGEQESVPVGTTVRDVLWLRGKHEVSKVRMYRWDAGGRQREVFLKAVKGTESIPLISGDSICFE